MSNSEEAIVKAKVRHRAAFLSLRERCRRQRGFAGFFVYYS
jgi:hypothetical protein